MSPNTPTSSGELEAYPKEHPLDEEEQQLAKELAAGEWTSDPENANQKVHLEKVARNTLAKSERISIRLTKGDLDALKQRAAREGLPYQTLMSSVLHKYVTGQLAVDPSGS